MVDFETKRSYTLKVEGSNPHVDPQFLAWGPYKDEATIKVNMLYMFVRRKSVLECVRDSQYGFFFLLILLLKAVTNKITHNFTYKKFLTLSLCGLEGKKSEPRWII